MAWRLVAWLLALPWVVRAINRRAQRSKRCAMVARSGVEVAAWWALGGRWQLVHLMHPDATREQHPQPRDARIFVLSGYYTEQRGERWACHVEGTTNTVRRDERTRVAYVDFTAGALLLVRAGD